MNGKVKSERAFRGNVALWLTCLLFIFVNCTFVGCKSGADGESLHIAMRSVIVHDGLESAFPAVEGLRAFIEVSFSCDTGCHAAMEETYEAELGQECADQWGNAVSDASSMLAPLHRVQNGDTCLTCHALSLEQLNAMTKKWANHDSDIDRSGFGKKEAEELSSGSLETVRDPYGVGFCFREECHGHYSSDDLIQATEGLGRNPHVQQHGSVYCGDCHKSHRASVNYCSKCHSDAAIPDGWVTVDEDERRRAANQ